MKRINAYFVLGILLPLCCLSCENSKEKTVEYNSERFDDTTPEFDSNRQSIIYKEYMSDGSGQRVPLVAHE